VGLERGPHSLVSTTEEILGRKSSGSDLETENTAVGIRHADHVVPPILQKLALTPPTSGGRSVGAVEDVCRIEAPFLTSALDGGEVSFTARSL
jgi:hypothetical protein